MEFTIFDIVKLLKIKRSSLKQWIERGFIRPSIQEADGKGTKNLFSVDDLYKIVLFEKLHFFGLAQKIAAKYADEVDFSQVNASRIKFMFLFVVTGHGRFFGQFFLNDNVENQYTKTYSYEYRLIGNLSELNEVFNEKTLSMGAVIINLLEIKRTVNALVLKHQKNL